MNISVPGRGAHSQSMTVANVSRTLGSGKAEATRISW